MLHCEVIGAVWSSVKVSGLDHRKLLLVRPVNHGPSEQAVGLLGTLVAVDCVDAGPGDHVIVALGRAARNAVHQGIDLPIEAAIVAILDGWDTEASNVEVSSKTIPKKTRPKKKSSSKKSPKKKSSRKKASKKPPASIDETGELFGGIDEAERSNIVETEHAEPSKDESSVIPEEEAELPGFDDVDEIWDSADDDTNESPEPRKDA